MWNIVGGLLTALALTALTSVLTFAVSIPIEQARKRRALARLNGDPLFYQGAHIVRLELPGHPVPLMVDCEVTRFALGMVEIQQRNRVPGERVEAMTFTVREFEQLHPIFALQ